MESLGYKVTVGPNGMLKAEDADGTEDAVALSTNYTKWKTDHPSLKVSRPAEDICYCCYLFTGEISFRYSEYSSPQMFVHSKISPTSSNLTYVRGMYCDIAFSLNGRK
jgi:hypothetical protein